ESLPQSGPDAQVLLTESVGRRGAQPIVRNQGGVLMTLKKIAICAAALVAATIASQLAQAGSKGGPSPGGSGSSPDTSRRPPARTVSPKTHPATSSMILVLQTPRSWPQATRRARRSSL